MPNVERTLAEKEGAAYKPTGPAGGIDIVGPDLSAVPEEGKVQFASLGVLSALLTLAMLPGLVPAHNLTASFQI